MRNLFWILAALFLALAAMLTVSNRLTDIITSKALSLYFDRFIHVHKIKLSVKKSGLFVSCSRVDTGYTMPSSHPALSAYISEVGGEGRIVLTDVLLALRLRGGTLYGRLLKGWIGAGAVRGEFVFKNRDFENMKFLFRTRISTANINLPVRPVGSEARGMDENFKTIKIYARNGRLAVWDKKGLMLEAGWQ